MQGSSSNSLSRTILGSNAPDAKNLVDIPAIAICAIMIPAGELMEA